MVIALVLSVLAAALVVRSVTTLRLAERDLQRLRVEYLLSGAQSSAAVTLSLERITAAHAWTLRDQNELIAVRAQPDLAKSNFSAAAVASDSFFARFGVQDVGALRARLGRARAEEVVDVAGLDAATLWRRCASNFISRYGGSSSPDLSAKALPLDPAVLAVPRGNEIWRIQVTTSTGWTDDRTVRLTGRPEHPAAVIARKFGHAADRGEACEDLFAAPRSG